MIRRSILLPLLALAPLVAARADNSAMSAQARSTPRPAFTMRFDDNRPASWWRDVGTIFERHGFRCSFAVNSAGLSESQGACLKELAALGHEIMDHTPSHSIYLAKYPDAESFERARRLPFAHDADPETRMVFFNWDVRDDHPSNTTFRARVEAGRLVPVDGKTAPKGHCFLKLPGHEGVFGIKAEGGILELRDFWRRKPPEPLNLPECDILRYSSAALRPCDGLLRELASLSRERFDHFGIPRPTSWVFPGGWCSRIPQDSMERVYGRGFGYRTADAQLGAAQLGESPWYIPYNAMLFFDQGPDITAEGLVDGIEKRLAAGKWHITLSHMMTKDIKDFLARTERFAQILEERRIPVMTLADSVVARFPETAAKPAMEVTLTFDDSAKEHATIIAPMLAESGWHGTFNIVAGDVGVREDALTWDDARDLVRAGHILVTHTSTHKPFTRLPAEGNGDDLRREILDSTAKIEAETGFRVNEVCLPGNAWNQEVQKAVEACGFRVQETRRANVGGESFDVAKFRAMLEGNVSEGHPICVLMFHGIEKTGSRPFPNGAADIRAVFDVLRDMERSGVIRVISGKTERVP